MTDDEKLRYQLRLAACMKNLNRLQADLKKDFPDAMLYCEASGTMHLMTGQPHDDLNQSYPERSIAETTFDGDCGEW